MNEDRNGSGSKRTGAMVGGVVLSLLGLIFVVGGVHILQSPEDHKPGVFGLITGLVFIALGVLVWKPWVRR